MKKTLTPAFALLYLILLNSSLMGQNTIKEFSEFSPGNITEEQILYLKDSTKGIFSKQNSNEEINYLSNGISNVGFKISGNKIYFWWDTCDDMTNSSFVILKTIDNINYQIISDIKNIPNNNHIPILYCSNFPNSTPFQNQFYLLYKKFENNSMAHIITLVVPKQQFGNALSKLQ